MATGRPSIFSQETADTICFRLAEGESLRAICEDASMPARSTVNLWLAKDATFSDQYARARSNQAQHYAEEIIDIADTEPDANKARVRIDARKWLAGKLDPKKYSDKLQIDQNTTLGMSDPLTALIERIATGGKRLIE